jgi:two-component system, OmpR family, phosphate regulon response regulator PhoB
MLPEVSGYEICQGVRLDPSLSDVKILMMTARGSAIERKKGMALGADGFITKPFELKELRQEVRRLLGQEA